MNFLIILGLSVVLVAFVIAGLSIKLIAGKKTTIVAGCCGSFESIGDGNTTCACGNEDCCSVG